MHAALLITLITCVRVPAAAQLQCSHLAKRPVALKPLEASVVRYVYNARIQCNFIQGADPLLLTN